MMLLDTMFWLLTSHCGTYIEPISRRFANLSYILWMVSVDILWAHTFVLAPYLQVYLYPHIYLGRLALFPDPNPAFLSHTCGKLSEGGGDEAIEESVNGRLWARDESVYFHSYSLHTLC